MQDGMHEQSNAARRPPRLWPRRPAAGAAGSMRFRMAPAIAAAALLAGGCSGPGGPPSWHSVHLTWQGDTSTTMTVNLVVEAAGYRERLPRSASLEWRPSGTEGQASSFAGTVAGMPVEIAGVPDVRVFRFELRDLEPGGSYDFTTAADGRRLGGVRSFRTVPREGPVRLAAGGDVDVEPLSLALLAQAGRQSPHMLVIGGDLAYANGLTSNWPRWRTWFDYVREALVTPDGHTIPLVVAIGNHEVNVGRAGGVSASAAAEEKAPFFFGLFAQNQGGRNPAEDGGATYFRRGLGEMGALYVLDTGHLVSHEEQAGWLAEQMAADAGLPNRVALYHVPLYPAHRSYEDSAEGRAAWEGVFDRGRLTAALENHDHVFKRSHPIRLGEIVEAGEGVLYLGDGCMGKDARTVDLEERWYLERSASEPHFWIAELHDDGTAFRAFDEEGRLLDSVSTRVSSREGEAPPDGVPSLPQLDRIVELPGNAVEVEPLWIEASDPPASTEGAATERTIEGTTIKGTLRNPTSFPMWAEFTVEAVEPASGEASGAPWESSGGFSLDAPLQPGAEAALAELLAGRGAEVPPSGSRLGYRLTFESGNGPSEAHGRMLLAPVELQSLPRTSFPLADASLDRWREAGAAVRRLDRPAEILSETAGDPWQGKTDASADLYFAWNDQALYFRADVTDDVVVGAEADAGAEWTDVDPDDLEAVLLFIDPWPERGREIDDPHVAVGPVGTEFEVEPHPAWTGEEPDTRVEVHESGLGYTVHLTVPWGWVTGGGAPERAALNVGLVDSDGSPQVHELYWFPSWENPERPLGQGTFELRP